MYTVKYARRLNASEAIDLVFLFLLGVRAIARSSAGGARDRSWKKKKIVTKSRSNGGISPPQKGGPVPRNFPDYARTTLACVEMTVTYIICTRVAV